MRHEVLNDQAPSYLKNLVVLFYSIGALCSQTMGLLVVPRAFMGTIREAADYSMGGSLQLQGLSSVEPAHSLNSG